MVSDDITFSSTTNFLNQKASLTASEVAIYLASIVESTMIGCLKFFQFITPPLQRNTYPDVDFLSSISDIKSEAMYPCILSFPHPNIKNISLVLLKYLRIFFIVIQYFSSGFN